MSVRNYYRSSLSGDLEKAYLALEKGLITREEIIEIPILSMEDFQYVLGAYQRENPLVFYVNYWKGMPAMFSEKSIFIKPIYEYVHDINTVQNAMLRACREIGTFRYDPLRQVMAIVEWMSKLQYVNTESSHEHNILGPLLNRKGVCEAFSLLFKAFCDHFNIDCMVAVGSVDGVSDLHAWNVVNYGGNNYNVDMTLCIDIAQKTGNQMFNVLVPDYIVDYYHCIDKPYCGVLRDNPFFLRDKTFFSLEELSRKLVRFSKTEKKFALLDASSEGLDALEHLDGLDIGNVRTASNMFRLYIFEC